MESGLNENWKNPLGWIEDGKMNRKRSRNDEEDDVDEFEAGMEMRKKKEKKIGRRWELKKYRRWKLKSLQSS